MRYENKTWHREGNRFYNSKDSFSLNHMRFLHSGIDTIKQLFTGFLKLDVIHALSTHDYDLRGSTVNFGGIDWKYSTSSKKTGYQFVLKNLDLGFVVLLKSFFEEEDKLGSHLKIEVTPQAIFESTPIELRNSLREVANLFLSSYTENSIAFHACVDIKGLEIPDDFEANLVTKARRKFKFNSISDAQYSLNETSVVYGNGQSYTFGSASAVQMTIYDKIAESLKSDKISFWESVWSQVPSVDDYSVSEYQQGDNVHRLELRFHHSIVREFCNGSKNVIGEKLDIRNVLHLCDHIDELFKYGLNLFRLQYSTSYIHPIWQSLMEDVTLFPPSPHFMYKRAKKSPTANSRRNTAFWLGNVIKLMSRKRMTTSHVVKHIINSGLESDLSDYFGCKVFGESEELYHNLHEFVANKMSDHLLNGVAA
ncbi:hypothetical protein IMCC1989_475 [gamma proteobacterium IMCC1989]|nr:hypothetical protein IMCC1989_475 [gamma proteobacterium IMCC1989]